MSEALCRGCGLCCDGTFFGSVVVEPEEVERLGRVGLPLFQEGDALGMEQPCHANRARGCAVYASRPTACAEYECDLHKRVASGERSLAEAQAHVVTFRALLVTLRDVFACEAPASFWHKLLLLEEEGRMGDAGALSPREYDLAVASVGRLLELGRAEFDPEFSF